MKGIEEKCLAAGYSGYFPKPINIDALTSKLAQLLDGKAVVRPKQQLEALLGGSAQEEAIADNAIRSSLDMTQPKLRAIVERFLIRLDEKFQEFEQALQAKHFNQLNELGHWLKGSAGSVGLQQLMAPAIAIEDAAKQQNAEPIAGLIEQLKAMAARIELTPATTQQVRPVAPTVTPNNSGNRDAIYSTLDMSNPKLRTIVERFVERLGDKLNEFEAALKAENYTELDELGHWLKGSAGSVGLHELVAPAKELEIAARAENNAVIDDLIKQLRQLSEKIEISSTAAEQQGDDSFAMTSSAVASSPQVFTEDYVVRSRLPNTEKFRPLILRFVKRLAPQLDLMDEALQCKDFEQLDDLAHWLKGSAGTVGFDEFTAIAKQLQDAAKASDEEASAIVLMVIKRRFRQIEVDNTNAMVIVGKSSHAQIDYIIPEVVRSALVTDAKRAPLVAKFITRLQQQVQRMQEAATASDYEKLEELATWLKGAVASVGFEIFYAPAVDLERFAIAQQQSLIEHVMAALQQLTDRLEPVDLATE
jgi:HPt (histidine-containing phosphotransfer) domain-containing protein